MTPIDRFHTDNRPIRITKRLQLLVEGNDQRNFAEALLSQIGRNDIEVQNFGGVTQLGDFLAALQGSASFEIVEAIGILRDAERGVAAAFQSVQDSLKTAALPVPNELGSRAAGAPGVTVFILGGDGGMLETLLNRTVADEPEQRCVEEFLRCVEKERGEAVRNPHKSRAHAWIATQDRPEVSVGVAAKRKYWALDHPILDDFRAFLRSL